MIDERKSDVYPQLSLVVPLHNEERRVAALLTALQVWAEVVTYPAEVLLVSDGSTDQTDHIIRSQLNRLNSVDEGFRVKLLVRDENYGKGGAVAAGLQAARGEWVVSCDADLAAPLSEVDKIVALLADGADMAIAVRRPHLRYRIYDTLVRDVVSIGLNLMIRLWTPGIVDTQCGLKGYRRRTALVLASLQRTGGFAFDIEHLMLARRLGLEIRQVRVTWQDVADSKIQLVPAIRGVLKDLFKLMRFNRQAPVVAPISVTPFILKN